jgi:hypothetical protein
VELLVAAICLQKPVIDGTLVREGKREAESSPRGFTEEVCGKAAHEKLKITKALNRLHSH